MNRIRPAVSISYGDPMVVAINVRLPPTSLPRAVPGLTVRNLCFGLSLFVSGGLVTEPIGVASNKAFL